MLRVHVSEGRASGFGDPNQYAAYLVLFIPLFMSKALFSANAINKLVFSTILLASFVSFVIAGSRGGAVAMLLSAVVYFYILWRGRHIRVYTLIVLVIVVAPSLVTLSFVLSPDKIQETVIERFDAITSSDPSEFTAGRTVLWSNGLRLFLQSPIYGHGQDTFITLMRQNFAIWGNSHNDYLLYLVHFGIIGLSLFLLLLRSLFRDVRSIYGSTSDSKLKLLSISYLAGFSGYAVAMFGVNIIQPQMLFWAYSAAILKYGRIQLQRERVWETP